MSSTRYAGDNEPFHQNRFASDPIYAGERGVNGTAAAAKATLLRSNKASGLIYFLQSLSRADRGLRGVATDLLDQFPERIGTRAMHEYGIKPGKVYNPDQTAVIEREIDPWKRFSDSAFIARKLAARQRGKEFKEDRPVGHTASVESLLAKCVPEIEKLEAYLVELCVNPHIKISIPGELAGSRDGAGASENRADAVFHFRDLIGALLEYQQSYNERAAKQIAMTTVASEVYGALDYALKTGKMVLLGGNSRIGKSESTRAWCDMHRDRVRYLQLTGITNRTSFFRRLAAALGVCDGMGLSASKVQARCEVFLEKTRLMLVIDESQYLWPDGNRVESQPELINWLNTSCFNHGVPVALVATNEFHRRRKVIERNTSWSSEQLSGRIGRAFDLPAAPTVEDMFLVAQKVLPAANEQVLKTVVTYATASQRYLQAISDVRDDARLICEDAGRSEITAADLAKAIKVYRLPSDEIMRRHNEPEIKPRRKGTVETPAPSPAIREAAPINEPISPSARRTAAPLQMPRRETAVVVAN